MKSTDVVASCGFGDVSDDTVCLIRRGDWSLTDQLAFKGVVLGGFQWSAERSSFGPPSRSAVGRGPPAPPSVQQLHSAFGGPSPQQLVIQNVQALGWGKFWNGAQIGLSFTQFA